MQDDKIPEEEAQEEGQFELSPEQATVMDGSAQPPGLFNRKRVLIALCISFSAVICGGLVFNALKPPKKPASVENELPASNTPAEFLSSLRDRSLRRADSEPVMENTARQEQAPEPEPLLPPVSFNMSPEVESIRAPQPQQYQPPPAQVQAPQAPAQAARQPEPTHFRSSLIPQVQGSLFSGAGQIAQNAPAPAQQGSAVSPYGTQASEYAAQNNQQPFYDSPNGGAAYNGRYLGENAVWAGTVIPGILETAVNTDLPGNVLARVTQNVFDSQTGRALLIPQGTLLLARYNSSVSYAQHRVQIVWDTMIRPDGFQIDLGGANGVDRSGMSGQEAKYDENWFEYVKAAGIITLFSVANAGMTESAARHATDASAANIAEANSQLVNQLGGNLAARAMNIQPTLTVENGTLINIMLNSTLYLPPVPAFPPAQRYVLE